MGKVHPALHQELALNPALGAAHGRGQPLQRDTRCVTFLLTSADLLKPSLKEGKHQQEFAGLPPGEGVT